MKEFWNEKYGADEYVYGTVPNTFLHEQLQKLKPGTILFPCEGEGRNAVYAAANNWKVSAFDMSEAGKEKALILAQKQGVNIDYVVKDALEVSYEPNSFDAIALIYAHFPPNIRQQIHQKMATLLKPGGVLILEAFNPNQLLNTSGGPKDVLMLYTEDMLLHDFKDLSSLELSTQKIILDEGTLHQGSADVIRYVGLKQK